jgi:hypothetical protein
VIRLLPTNIIEFSPAVCIAIKSRREPLEKRFNLSTKVLPKAFRYRNQRIEQLEMFRDLTNARQNSRKASELGVR